MSPLKSSLTHQQQAVFYTNILKNRINPPKKGHYQLLEKTIDALSERLYEVAEKLGRANRKIQSLEATNKTLNLEPFADKWQAFGWNTFEVDGHKHDFTTLEQATAYAENQFLGLKQSEVDGLKTGVSKSFFNGRKNQLLFRLYSQ